MRQPYFYKILIFLVFIGFAAPDGWTASSSRSTMQPLPVATTKVTSRNAPAPLPAIREIRTVAASPLKKPTETISKRIPANILSSGISGTSGVREQSYNSIDPDFATALNNETQATKLMAEIYALKNIEREKQIEKIVTKIFDENNNAVLNTPQNSRSTGIFSRLPFFGSRANTPPPAPQKAAPAIKETTSSNLEGITPEVLAKQATLQKIENELDLLYAKKLVAPSNKANPFIKNNTTTNLAPEQKARWALLSLHTQFRRNLDGEPLHAESRNLIKDKDCTGDLVTSQLLLKEGLSLLSKDYPSAVVANNQIITQTLCMSARQLAVADDTLNDALEQILENLDEQTSQLVVDVMMNPLLALYDAGKAQYSRVFEFMNAHQKEVVNAYREGSALKKMGVYLLDWKTGKINLAKFTSPTSYDIDTAFNQDINDVAMKDFQSGKTTLYGIDIKELQMQCDKPNAVGAMPAANNPSGPQNKGGEAPSWSGFGKSMGNGSSMGNGAGSLLETLAAGKPDMTGLCGGGGGGAGGGGGGMTCESSSGDPYALTDMVKPQGCHANAAPNLGQLTQNFMGGAEGAGGNSGGPSAEGGGSNFKFKGEPSCGGSPISDDNPNGGGIDPEEQKRRDNLDKKVSENKQKAQDAIDKDDKAKKLADEAKKEGAKFKEKDIAAAKATADKALADAKTASDIKATVSGGVKTVKDGDGNVIGQSPCNGCSDGSTNLGGNTHVENGKSDITLDREDKGPVGLNNAMHEWAHAFLSALKVQGGAQHEIMHNSGTGIKYCAPGSDSCSDGCNGLQAALATFYMCNASAAPENANCSKLDADCAPPDLAADKGKNADGSEVSSTKAGGGSTVSGGSDKVGGGGGLPSPSWCTQASFGPDGGVPPACAPAGGAGSNCHSSGGVSIDIFSIMPSLGYTDPPPWQIQQGQAAQIVQPQMNDQQFMQPNQQQLDQQSATPNNMWQMDGKGMEGQGSGDSNGGDDKP